MERASLIVAGRTAPRAGAEARAVRTARADRRRPGEHRRCERPAREPARPVRGTAASPQGGTGADPPPGPAIAAEPNPTPPHPLPRPGPAGRGARPAPGPGAP